MKIVKRVNLNNGTCKTAFIISNYMTVAEISELHNWLNETGIRKYFTVKSVYVSDSFGDINMPAIQVTDNAPDTAIAHFILKYT